MGWKLILLDVAELVDAWRVFVRIIMVAYAFGYVLLVQAVWEWFVAIPDPTTAQTTFATGLVAAVGTMLTFLTNTYVKTGRHWNGRGE